MELINHLIEPFRKTLSYGHYCVNYHCFITKTHPIFLECI
jgi:hypothetical protein